MKRLIPGAVLFAILATVCFLSTGQAHAARPQNDTTLLLQLNGEPRRWIMSDGGLSGMFGSGLQCMPISGGETLLLQPSAEVHLCVNQLDAGWDGGCNTTVTDLNYGAAFSTDKYLSTQNTTKMICEVPTTGSANVPAFILK